MMFWIGFGVGLIIGGCVGVFAVALCIAAKSDDYNNTK